MRRIVPKSAATTGQQQRRSVLNDRRQLEAARQRKEAEARAAKARKALSPEFMRKAAAAMFEKASVAQQNATQASR